MSVLANRDTAARPFNDGNADLNVKTQSAAPDVSVILVCWNSYALTAAAIRSLEQHVSGASYEVIVVDNGSSDERTSKRLAAEFPTATVIANRENRGFAGANNQALAVARGRYLLLLNSDTEQIENAVGRAVEYMDLRPEVGVLGVMHRNADVGRTYQSSAASFPTPARSAAGMLRGLVRPASPIEETPAPEGEVDWVTGSFFMIRRACLDAVGPLDEARFFVYAEDIDWCYMAWKAGWKVRYWPGTSIVHYGSSSASQVADKTFMLYRNELEFFRKHYRAPNVFLFYASLNVRMFASLLYQGWNWIRGKSAWTDVAARWDRLWNLVLLKPDRRGLK
jgi:GT2 family glycosyltransferase